jgi:hypothetical protein
MAGIAQSYLCCVTDSLIYAVEIAQSYLCCGTAYGTVVAVFPSRASAVVMVPCVIGGHPIELRSTFGLLACTGYLVCSAV